MLPITWRKGGWVSNFNVCFNSSVGWILMYVLTGTWLSHVTLMTSSLTHWGRVTHICVSKPTIIGSDNGLSPGRRQAIIRTNDGILLIGPLGTIFSEILIRIQIFSFKKMRLKMSSGKWRPSCLCLNVLTGTWLSHVTSMTCWLKSIPWFLMSWVSTFFLKIHNYIKLCSNVDTLG